MRFFMRPVHRFFQRAFQRVFPRVLQRLRRARQAVHAQRERGKTVPF